MRLHKHRSLGRLASGLALFVSACGGANGGRAGSSPNVVILPLDRPPVGPPAPSTLAAFPFVLEVFLLGGDQLLQLTNESRNDVSGAVLTADSRRVVSSASANPPTHGVDGAVIPRNPSNNCQLFSIDRNGGDLRQLTDFRETEISTIGCYFGSERVGCTATFVDVDRVTGTVVFSSTCDPLGGNPHGSQIFAMRPDGSGLRQITTASGLLVEPDGGEALELVGPHAYSAPVRGTRPQ
jgi:hypothetical protein